MLGHWHFSLLWTETNTQKNIPENFRSMTRIHLEHVDNHEIMNIYLTNSFRKKILKHSNKFHQLFICACTNIQARNTYYNVPLPGTFFFEQLSSKNLAKNITFQRFISTKKNLFPVWSHSSWMWLIDHHFCLPNLQLHLGPDHAIGLAGARLSIGDHRTIVATTHGIHNRRHGSIVELGNGGAGDWKYGRGMIFLFWLDIWICIYLIISICVYIYICKYIYIDRLNLKCCKVPFLGVFSTDGWCLWWIFLVD